MATVGKINSLESFGLVDGPGVRFVVFTKGCRMRCKYCHNPETWTMEGATEWEPAKLLDRACRFKSYWKNNGGITVSGGEPLLQIDFLLEFFQLAKERGIHTCVDTSGNPFTKEGEFFEKFQKLMEVTDLFILDIKQTNPIMHKELTGQENENIIEMARFLSEQGKDLWVRRVLVPGLTDEEEELKQLKTFLDSLKTLRRVEVLPYHTMAIPKWEKLGIPYALEGVPSPTEEEVKRAEKILGIVKNEK